MVELRSSDGFKVLVHKSLLCHYSKYYDAAINGGFQEASNTSFELDLNETQAKSLISWLYSGFLDYHLSPSDTEDLFCLYIFSDKTDILALRRLVMSMLVEGRKTKISYRLLAMVTNSLPPSDALYRFAVCWFAHHWTPSETETSGEDPFYEELSNDVLHQVMCSLALRARFANGSDGSRCACCDNPCDFHDHKSYEEWHASCFTFGQFRRYPTNMEPTTSPPN